MSQRGDRANAHAAGAPGRRPTIIGGVGGGSRYPGEPSVSSNRSLIWKPINGRTTGGLSQPAPAPVQTPSPQNAAEHHVPAVSAPVARGQGASKVEQSMGFGNRSQTQPQLYRWQPKGPTPLPVTPMQTMHKAKEKYVPGKVSGLEEAKRRQLNCILNKLTARNFWKLYKKLMDVVIASAETLSWLVSRIYPALMEPNLCETYTNLCVQLVCSCGAYFTVDNKIITFKKILLNICQVDFERWSQRKEAEAEINQIKEEREERRIDARRRLLGNVRFLGELYKRRILIGPIMHQCVVETLLGDFQNPDEENIEVLCKLMSTIGEKIDHPHPKAKELMDGYFEIMQKLSTSHQLSARVRFMLGDTIVLRNNKWQQNRKLTLR